MEIHIDQYNQLLLENTNLRNKVKYCDDNHKNIRHDIELRDKEYYNILTDIIDKNVDITKLKEENIEQNKIIQKLEDGLTETKEFTLNGNDALAFENLKLLKIIEELKEENTKLKKNIELQNIKIIELETTITNHEITITNHEITITNHEITIANHEKTIINHEITIANHETTITKLEKTIDIMNIREFKNKLLISIQDLNEQDQLEKNLKSPYKQNIMNLHQDRINMCHYIINKDNLELINYKKYTLLNNLVNAPNKVIKLIENKYGQGFINELIKHIKSSKLLFDNLTDDEKETVDDWWIY